MTEATISREIDQEGPTVERQLALILTATPSLRAKLFANPTRQVGRSLPPAKYWKYGEPTLNPFARWWRLRNARRKVAARILKEIAGQVERHELAATVNTDAVFEEFFAPIVKVSQRSFSSVTLLSWATFIAGVVMIVGGLVVALLAPKGVNSTVVSSVFGGTGAISALGAIYASAKQGIREATVDVARLRMVLTAFATQLGQLRAIAEAPPDKDNPVPPTLDDIGKINKAITTVTDSALKQIPAIAERAAAAADTKRPPRPRGAAPSPKAAKGNGGHARNGEPTAP